MNNSESFLFCENTRLQEEIETLRQQLAEATKPQGEPVGWLFTNIQSGFRLADTNYDRVENLEVWHRQPLYTAHSVSPVNRRLLEAAKSVVARWDSTDWKLSSTARYIDFLRDAIAEAEGGGDE